MSVCSASCMSASGTVSGIVARDIWSSVSDPFWHGATGLWGAQTRSCKESENPFRNHCGEARQLTPAMQSSVRSVLELFCQCVIVHIMSPHSPLCLPKPVCFIFRWTIPLSTFTLNMWYYIYNLVKTFFFFRICKEFEAIQDRALKVPETTEDMIEMITYINEVKTKELEELSNKIMVGTSELFTFTCS